MGTIAETLTGRRKHRVTWRGKIVLQVEVTASEEDDLFRVIQRDYWRDARPSDLPNGAHGPEAAQQEALTFEQEVMVAVLKDTTPAFTKWSEIANRLCYHFKISATFNSTACFNPKGSAAMAEVITTMGKTLDLAVDNAWAGLPPEKFMKMAADLEASRAGQKEV